MRVFGPLAVLGIAIAVVAGCSDPQGDDLTKRTYVRVYVGSEVDNSELSVSPIGTIALFHGPAELIPSNWRKCLGQSIAGDEYLQLRESITEQSGAGLKLPDCSLMRVLMTKDPAKMYGNLPFMMLQENEDSPIWAPVTLIVKVEL